MIKPKKPPNLWFPSLLQTANGITIDSDSWFNIKKVNNPNQYQLVNQSINTTFLKTKKYIIYPNDNQKNILQKWFHNVISMYNITNQYLKNYYQENNKIESFFEIRKVLKLQSDQIAGTNKINKHILDYSVKHCVEMYKSCITNFKNKKIKRFDLKDLLYSEMLLLKSFLQCSH
jgi:hypothetical protein